jgi:hypothetical protein
MESAMQSNAVEHAHRETLRGAAGPNQAARAAAAHWPDGRADFLHQSHCVAESAAGFMMGMTLSTLAMYNLALWLMR